MAENDSTVPQSLGNAVGAAINDLFDTRSLVDACRALLYSGKGLPDNNDSVRILDLVSKQINAIVKNLDAAEPHSSP